MRRVIFLILPVALLTACSMQKEASSPSFSLQPSDRAVEGETMQSVSGSGTMTGSGMHVMAERLLPSGMLEIGSSAAPLSMLHITNLSCRYCQQFLTENLQKLIDDFVKTGKLRISIALMPLKRYPESVANAGLVYCSAAQGKGWQMLLLLSQGVSRNSTSWLKELTARKIDLKMLQSCTADTTLPEKISIQQSFIGSLGVSLVPTSFINGEKIQGVPAYPDLRGRIEALMENTK